MGFLVSPGVQVREIDLTNIVPAVQTNIGAVAGPFAKGPVSSVTAISSEEELVYLDVYTTSPQPIHYQLSAQLLPNFKLK